MRMFRRIRHYSYRRGRHINPTKRHTKVQIGILLAVVTLCAVVIAHSFKFGA